MVFLYVLLPEPAQQAQVVVVSGLSVAALLKLAYLAVAIEDHFRRSRLKAGYFRDDSIGANQRKFHTGPVAVTTTEDKAVRRSPALKVSQDKRLNPQEELVLRHDFFLSGDENGLIVESPKLGWAVQSLEGVKVNRYVRVVKVSGKNEGGPLRQGGAAQRDVLNCS
jgi:hypothetical protein